MICFFSHEHFSQREDAEGQITEERKEQARWPRLRITKRLRSFDVRWELQGTKSIMCTRVMRLLLPHPLFQSPYYALQEIKIWKRRIDVMPDFSRFSKLEV